MGQQEVYEMLKNKRLSGDDRFFSISHIRSIVLDNSMDTNSAYTTSKNVNRLWMWGLLEKKEFKGVRKFRFKKSILEQSSL